MRSLPRVRPLSSKAERSIGKLTPYSSIEGKERGGLERPCLKADQGFGR